MKDKEPKAITVQIFRDRDPELFEWLKTASKNEERSINSFGIRLLKQAMSSSVSK